jgi:hypothetical protein
LVDHVDWEQLSRERDHRRVVAVHQSELPPKAEQHRERRARQGTGEDERGLGGDGSPARVPTAKRLPGADGGADGLPGPEIAIFGCEAPVSPIEKSN